MYSLEGVLDYYTSPGWVLRDGQPAQVTLSEVEPVSFPDPVGTLEAFHTAGGLSTMPWRFAGRIQTMEYKAYVAQLEQRGIVIVTLEREM